MVVISYIISFISPKQNHGPPWCSIYYVCLNILPLLSLYLIAIIYELFEALTIWKLLTSEAVMHF